MGANSRGETPAGAGHGGHGAHGAWPGHGVTISDGRNLNKKNTSIAICEVHLQGLNLSNFSCCRDFS